MDGTSKELKEISEQIETSVDTLVEDITKITNLILEKYAQDSEEESLKVERVS